MWTFVVDAERIFSLEIIVSIYGDHVDAYIQVLVLEKRYLIEWTGKVIPSTLSDFSWPL